METELEKRFIIAGQLQLNIQPILKKEDWVEIIKRKHFEKLIQAVVDRGDLQKWGANAKTDS